MSEIKVNEEENKTKEETSEETSEETEKRLIDELVKKDKEIFYSKIKPYVLENKISQKFEIKFEEIEEILEKPEFDGMNFNCEFLKLLELYEYSKKANEVAALVKQIRKETNKIVKNSLLEKLAEEKEIFRNMI